MNEYFKWRSYRIKLKPVKKTKPEVKIIKPISSQPFTSKLSLTK
jgi:hypothetical protein